MNTMPDSGQPLPAARGSTPSGSPKRPSTSKRRPQRIALRPVVIEGRAVLEVADDLSRQRIKDKRLSLGEVVFAEIKKPRNPRFHALAHQLGRLIAENVDDFTGMDAHRALKRMQMESGAGCEEVAYRIAGQMVVQRIPQSLAFESMDEGEFRGVMRGLCQYVADRYWPDLSPEQIERMAGCMVEV